MKTTEPLRAVLNISIGVPDGETARDVAERIQKFFSYYHPRYQAEVSVSDETATEVLERMDRNDVGEEELSAEECALLGIDPSALDLLG